LGAVWSFLAGLRASTRSLASGPVEGEQRVVGALAERTKELLAEEDFEVSTDGLLVTIRGVGQFRGRSNTLMPVFIWRAPLPATERLTMVFESASLRLQEFLTAAYGRPWPAPNAKAHVSVSDDLISVWWGGDTEAEAIKRLRPIFRTEVGV
jgi:hypothetical protein